jgi:hypothetical protein
MRLKITADAGRFKNGAILIVNGDRRRLRAASTTTGGKAGPRAAQDARPLPLAQFADAPRCASGAPALACANGS